MCEVNCAHSTPDPPAREQIAQGSWVSLAVIGFYVTGGLFASDSSRPDPLPVFAASSVLRTLPDVETIRLDDVAIAAARAASPPIMHAQLDATQRALGLDDSGDRALSLLADRLDHCVTVSLQVISPRFGYSNVDPS